MMNSDLAFLRDGDKVYFSRHLRRPGEPASAVTILIQGIYEKDPEFARKILRNKIYFTGQASEMCFGMVKVAAKKLVELGPHEFSGLPTDATPIEIRPIVASPLPRLEDPAFPFKNRFATGPISPQEWMEQTVALANQIQREKELYESDRQVAALLISSDGKVLAAAQNTNSRNRTLHAEVNLLQRFHSQSQNPIPRGSSLYIALKPCKMCAAMIWECAEAPQSLRIYYGQDDLGSLAKATVLDPRSHEWKRAKQRQPGRYLPDEPQQLMVFLNSG